LAFEIEVAASKAWCFAVTFDLATLALVAANEGLVTNSRSYAATTIENGKMDLETMRAI